MDVTPKTTSLIVPDAAVKYIAFQRTEVLRFRKTLSYAIFRKLLGASFYNYRVERESRNDADRIKRFYADDIAREFSTIERYLPASADTVLDIGCGVAGINAFINRHFSSQPVFYLLDKSSTEDSVFYGYKSTGAFYNSLDIARDVLVINGVAESSIQLIEATEDNAIDIRSGIDVVISLISWGFHYPVGTYLDRVHDILNPGGRMILDVRKQRGGMEQIRARFDRVEVIVDDPKFDRVLAFK